jgi:lysophospholipase L1-like esterase
MEITHTLTDLTPGQTYYYRLAAQDGGVTVKGDISNFTTHNPPPSVATDNATGVLVDGATLVARVNPNGVVTTVWFEYGISPTLSTFTTSESHDLSAGNDNVTVEIPLTGLAGYQVYYFRAVASSVEGTVKGNILSFSTELPPPAATTGSAGNITTSGAILNGTVNPNGFPTETWFEYGMDNTLSTYVETGHVGRGSGITNIDISTNLAGISAYTTYYYRLVAGSTADTDIYTKGIIKSFKTGDYYVAIGDSITLGSHDTIPADDIGYEPILEEQLTAAKNYPHVVLNAGASGAYSSNGLSAVTAILNDSDYASAKYFLIMYGTNDALTPVSKSVYKSNIQSIITAVKNAGRVPYLAKVPYTTDSARSDSAIQEYNQAIDELRSANGISVAAPDFYTWFKNHPSDLDDGIHPNGTGYQSMAAKWFEVLP